MKTNRMPHRLSGRQRSGHVTKRIVFRLLAAMLLTSLAWLNAAPLAAQSIDLMQAGPGEVAGALRQGELLVSALRREKVEATSANRALKSLGEVFPMRLCRSNDKYLIKVNSARKLTLLRYQRHQHVYETILTESGKYESRLLDDAHAPSARDMVIEPPATESVAGNEYPPQGTHTSNPDIDTADDPIPDLVYPSPAGADDVRPDEDFAPPDAPPQPIDAALLGKPNPDEFPPVPHPDVTSDDDDERPGPPLDHDMPDNPASDDLPDTVPVPNAVPNSTIHASDHDIVQDSLPTAQQRRANPSRPSAYNAANEPTIIPLPTAHTARPEQAHPYSPYSLALACMGLLACIAAFLITRLPAWRARKRLIRAGLTIEDEICIADGQRLVKVNDTKHHYLIAVSASKFQLLTCCDDDDSAQRAWAFFKRKTYWTKLADRPLNENQLAELIQKFNEIDAADATQTPDDLKDTIQDNDKPTLIRQGMILSATPTLPATMMASRYEAQNADLKDDMETLEVLGIQLLEDKT